MASAQLLLMLTADLVAGRAVDVVPDRGDAMFLPEVLRRESERFFGVPSTLVLQRRKETFVPATDFRYPFMSEE